MGNNMYKKFEAFMKERNLSPYKVAQQANISQPTLSDWKHGKSEPKRSTLEKICTAYNLPISYFYESQNEDAIPSTELNNVYFSLAKEAQENNIDPRDIKMALEMLKKLKGEK